MKLEIIGSSLNKFKENKFSLAIFFLIFLKLLYSFYIPINFIPGAPHDDSLFYRLGLNISQGEWLGAYQNTTLIKGVGFPLFLTISFLTKIPVRILEALLVCAASLYFVMLFKERLSKNTLIFLFAIVIFYPFQYGAVDYRLLRDMIYPQLLLLMFTALLYIYSSIYIKSPVRLFLNSCAFGTLVFLFQNTREEGIWVTPGLIFISGLILYKFVQLKKEMKLLICILISASIYATLNFSIIRLNSYYYGAPIINIWKDKNFQSGYGALQRLSANNLLLDHITFNNWSNFSEISPSVLSLKPFINEETYKGWIAISCGALKDNGYDISKNSGCYKEVIVSYSLFALNDALTNAGFKTPAQVSDFMGKVGSEIDSACDKGLIKCNPKPFSVLPAQLFYQAPDWKSIFSIFYGSILQTLTYKNPPLLSYQVDFDWDGVIKMRKRLGGYMFQNSPSGYKEGVFPANGSTENLAKKKENPSKYGYVDGINNKYGSVTVYGWALYEADKKFEKIEIYIGDDKLCESMPSLPRPDILERDPEKIGFKCSGKFNIRSDEPYVISAYANIDGRTFLLKNTEEVVISASNAFNERCYLKYNEDVSNALTEGRISSGKSHWLEYGKNETRRCAPIYSEQYSLEYYQKNIEKYSISNGDIVNKIFDLNSLLYYIFLLASPIIILIFYIFSIIKRDAFITSIVTTFLVLFIVRVGLLSFLHYYGVAQASSLYLLSGAYMYFIAAIVATFYIIENRYFLADRIYLSLKKIF
jgi:hypothetical protein